MGMFYRVDRLDRHADLMYRMSDTVGADLGEALFEGRLSGEKVRGAVLSCTRCDSVEACEQWLAKHEGDRAQNVPEFCRNRELLARLRR